MTQKFVFRLSKPSKSQKSQMSYKQSPSPLIINGDHISYPFCNSDTNISPVQSLLVNIKGNNQAETETISLKYCCMKYYPQYTNWLKKHQSHPIYPQIVNYYDQWIESPIHFVCECIFKYFY